jgi:hypothetical protein
VWVCARAGRRNEAQARTTAARVQGERQCRLIPQQVAASTRERRQARERGALFAGVRTNSGRRAHVGAAVARLAASGRYCAPVKGRKPAAIG